MTFTQDPSLRRTLQALRASFLNEPFSIKEVRNNLSLNDEAARVALKRLAKKGWIHRVKRGTYVFMDVGSPTENPSIHNPRILLPSLFRNYYLGGWSAANYWALTEQLFNTSFVYTSDVMSKKSETRLGAKFLALRAKNLHVGVTEVIEEGITFRISDPSRTIIDLFSDPDTYGGIKPLINVLWAYLRSEHYDRLKLLMHLSEIGSGAPYKRLGYTIECIAPGEKFMIKELHSHIRKGVISLDKRAEKQKLSTKWGLWVPKYELEPDDY